MVFSKVTIQDVATYLRLDDASDELLPHILKAARQYVENYTGQDTDYLDDYPDVAIALLVVCQDMYDNRSYYADKSRVNRVVASILGSHRNNFI